MSHRIINNSTLEIDIPKKTDKELFGIEPVKLIRVCYGRKETPVIDREYHMEGETAVGTLREWKKAFPKHKFEVKE